MCIRDRNSEDYLLAQIDAKLIVPVLINLINNAIKYTPPGTEIDVTWERRGSWIQVSVSDTGPGVPEQAKPHIFDMFYSASDPVADSRRSMGLGLALCKSCLLYTSFVQEFGVLRGAWYALFHSISAFCNAGFDLMGVKAPFSSLTDYAGHPVVPIVIALLIVEMCIRDRCAPMSDSETEVLKTSI